jgi:hypothetical protein
MTFYTDSEMEPADPREVVRVVCRSRQMLPVLEKGTEHWVWFNDAWRQCKVKGKIPGGCYRANLVPPVLACHEIVICSNNYGGPHS